MEKPKFNFEPRVLASINDNIRYKGSSGGVISHILKYLFTTNQIKTAINFRFSGVNLFESKLIYSYNEYEQTGSIYHEINIYRYLNEHIKEIKSPIAITCLPCQVLPIRRLLNKYGIDSIIISLVCSNQLEKEATYYFIEKNNIDINQVKDLRYRGNGWPSGIQIKTEKNQYFFHNNYSKWIDVFHSHIFSLDRCLSCTDTFGLLADISVADPWLKRYIKTDKNGSSIVITNTLKAESIINEMLKYNKLLLIEFITYDEVILSQKGTLIKKHLYGKYKKQIRFVRKYIKSNIYKKYFFYFSSFHKFIIIKMIAILKKIEGLQ